MYRKIAMAVATITTLLIGCPVAAQLQQTRVVTYRDLDLTQAADVAKLRHRTIHAINRVCLAPSPAGVAKVEDQDCRAEVMAKVQPRMMVAIELAAQRTASAKADTKADSKVASR